MGGYIMQLQHYSINDGEGIRTIVFFAGCPLRCAWCANPEGQTLQNPMTRWAETDEIVKEIRRQSIFYRFSGGGVTFSGGEAAYQPLFLAEVTNALYDEGFDLTIETSGCFDFEQLSPVLQKMSMIFMDLKHIDPIRHKRFTGMDNRLILENIQKTAGLSVPLVVRIPAILGVNADDAAMDGAFAFLQARAPNAALELLPYHRFGEEKYRQLGLALPDERFGTPTQAMLERWNDMARERGLRVVSYK